MYSVQVDWALPQPGFPIRKSTDITSAFDSPWLIVDCYVLHRLLVPRHPLCALSSLTMQSDLLIQQIRIMLFHFAFWILLSCIVQQYEIIVYPIIKLIIASLHTLFSFQGALFLNSSYFSISSPGSVYLIHDDVKNRKRIEFWWAQVDSNHRPHAYQACALTT